VRYANTSNANYRIGNIARIHATESFKGVYALEKPKRAYNEHESQIRGCFASAWAFFDKHKQPRSKADWDLIALDLGNYRDSFTSDLIIAVVDEMERECNHEMTRRPTL